MSRPTIPDEVARPLAHTGDPDASHEAAAHVMYREEIKAAIVWLLSNLGQLATFEIETLYFVYAKAYEWPTSFDRYSIRRRLSELHVHDHRVRVVVDTEGRQVRRRPVKGHSTSVWELVPLEESREAEVAA